MMRKTQLSYKTLDTPLDGMIALANEKELILLAFVDDDLESSLEKLQQKTNACLLPQETLPLVSIEAELKAYFDKGLTVFKTPLSLCGTPFQLAVWKELRKIPFGKTCSYSALAQAIGHPTAFRAAAQANGANRFPIVIPCHRVINANGKLGGYSAGLARKEWLLHHEEKSIGLSHACNGTGKNRGSFRT